MDAAGSLASLTASLGPLEQALAPLMGRPLNETLDSLAPVQQARLLVMLGYLTHDLSWIYLKTRGISPADHPVTPELDRIRSFFGKLKPYSADPSTVSSTPSAGPKPTTVLDKAAASRFLKHATGPSPSSRRPTSGAGAGVAIMEGEAQRVQLPEIRQVVKGKHKRFDSDGGSSESGRELEVFDGPEDQGAGGSGAKDDQTKEEKKRKRKKKNRRTMDPLEGYDDLAPSSTPATPQSGSGVPASSQPNDGHKPKRKKQNKPLSDPRPPDAPPS